MTVSETTTGVDVPMEFDFGDEPDIALADNHGETTLYINGGQAMQAWEAPLIRRAGEMLCERGGSEFLECGLGLGLSALAVANHPNTRHHTVVERFGRVVELFRERAAQPLPDTLEVVCDDFFSYIERRPSESVDGILYDPYVPKAISDVEAWRRHAVAECHRVLRPGGTFVPYFSTAPKFREEYAEAFPRMVMETAPYETYRTTAYTFGLKGWAFIQCYLKED